MLTEPSRSSTEGRSENFIHPDLPIGSGPRTDKDYMPPKITYQHDEIDSLPLLWSGDVVVVGGGSAGSAAATTAGRAGRSVLLIESGAFLGGTGVRVLDTFYGFYAPSPRNERVVGGIGWEICQDLFSMGMAFERPNTYGAGTGVTYEPEALKLVWDRVTADAGVSVLFYGLVTAVVMDRQRLVEVVVETKQGPVRVAAAVFIDATGDGELSWRAGALTDNGDGAEHLQPGTATFRVGGVADKTASTAELHALIAEAVDSGDFVLPRREGSSHVTVLPGVRHTNLTRVAGKDLTDPWQLTWAEQEGRRQAWEYARFLRERVPGYERSYLLGTAARLGIRESRRLIGEYVLSRDDFIRALSHEDDIARCGAPIEDHSAGAATHWEYVGGASEPDGATYGVPFGCLVPVEVDHLLVAGRFLSATHEAHASVRSIGQCLAMGQAAGTAAALAVESGTGVRLIDRQRLRDRLRSDGAII